MRITHLGHACLLIESAGRRLLIDPGSFSSGFAGLADLDAVLVTHQHADHLDRAALPGLLAANAQAMLVTDPQTAEQLTADGTPVRKLAAGHSVRIGAVTVEGIGGRHAVVHPDIDRIGNTGLVLRTAGEPSLCHPGDMIDTIPADIDVLALPLSAPWCAQRETVDFLRAVAPRAAFPIHDALLSTVGRAAYWRNISALAPDGTQLMDLAGAGPTEL